MVKHPNDPDGVAVHVVKDTMAAMGQASDRRRDFGAESSGQGVAAEQVECLAEAGEIGFSYLLAPLFNAVIQYGRQIGIRSGPKPDLSHAALR